MSISLFRRFTLLPIALWLISLVLPAAGWGKGEMGPGWQILLLGWMGLLNAQFGWVANIAFACSIPPIMSDRQPSSTGQFVLSLGLALPTLQALFWSKVHTDQGDYAVEVGVGYYVWLLAMFIQIIFLNAARRSPDA